MLSWDEYTAKTGSPSTSWSIDGIRVYDREVDKFVELWKIWKRDERARPQWHVAYFASDIKKYIDRFDNQPSVEIRMLLLPEVYKKQIVISTIG